MSDLCPSKTHRAGWVLVGGRSSRMGADKATADSRGRAMALRIADHAARVCAQVSLVGDPARYAGLGLPVVADHFPGQGPLAGIEAGLAASLCEYNLFIACDMPGISEPLLEEVFAALEDAGASAGCAMPRHPDGRVEPLCAAYHRRCHPVILRALEEGVRKVTDILPRFERQGLAVRYLRVSDPASFANLNTPEDWRNYHHG